MLLFSKKQAESLTGRHGHMLACPFCKTSPEEVGAPVPTPSSQLLRWAWVQYRGRLAWLDVEEAPIWSLTSYVTLCGFPTLGASLSHSNGPETNSKGSTAHGSAGSFLVWEGLSVGSRH